jgi:hypothetical protein
VRLVDDNKIPRGHHQLFGMAGGELERADDKGLLLEGAARSFLGHPVVVPGLQDQRREKEFFLHLLGPLLAEVSGRDDKDAPPCFRPLLRQHQPGFDGFPKANLVGKDRSLGEGRLEGEQRRLDLVGIEIDLRVEQRASQLRGVRYGMPFAQFVSE